MNKITAFANGLWTKNREDMKILLPNQGMTNRGAIVSNGSAAIYRFLCGEISTNRNYFDYE